MSKKVLIIAASLVLVLGTAVGVGAYFFIQYQSLSHSPEETARYVPAETSLYASMNLRPGAGQLMQAREILDLFKENPRFEEKLDEIYGDLEEETGIDVEQELFPWVGPEIALAIPTFEGIEETPEVVAFIGHTDKAAAESFLRKLMAFGQESGEMEYEEGVTRGRLTFVTDPSDDVSAHIALADDYIVIATGGETLESTLDRMESGQDLPSLFDDPGFQEAREAAESPRFGLMYIDVAGIIGQAGDDIFGEEIADSLQDFSDQLPDFIVASSSFIDKGILVSTSFDYPVQDQLFVPETDNSLGSAGLASEDTVALLSFVGVQDAWERLREEIADVPDLDLDEAFDEIEAEIGIDIERDILGWMTGELAFTMLLPEGATFSGDEIHANAYVEFDDRAGALSGMERIRSALEDGGVEFDVVDIEGNEAVVADVGEEEGTPNLTPGYVVLDNYVVIGTTLTALRQAVEAEKGDIPSLRESPAFSRPLEAAGNATDFMVYGDIRRITEEAIGQLDQTELREYGETAEPFVAPLEAFLLGVAVEEGLVTISAAITFATPTDALASKVATALASTPAATPSPATQAATPEPTIPAVPTAIPPAVPQADGDCTRSDDALPGLILDEPAHGAIDHEGEVDCFTFAGEAGQAYQVDVALGSLEDSVLAVYGGDYWESNDDFGDSAASRITFEAPVAASYYVEVLGWGGATGSYTVTVEAVSEAALLPTPTPAALLPTPTPAALLPEPTATAIPPASATVESDRAALVALYNATNGAFWVNSDNWLTSAPIGEWYGVTTDNDGRVTELVLFYNRLDGEIPPELGSLSNLHRLILYQNGLTGEIPSELGNLANLREVYLHLNGLSGEIPAELGDLANLRELSLDVNGLSGEIPSELGNLAHLEQLSLYRNQLDGEIPSELGNLANLRVLQLGENQLSGEIPAEFGNLSNLWALDLSGNRLTGCVPDSLRSQLDEDDFDLGGLSFCDSPTGPAAFTSVSAGAYFTCSLKTDGAVLCWGSNDDEEGNLIGQATPPGGPFDSFTSVSAGLQHACGVKTDGSVGCWGSNGDWEGNFIGQAIPPAVSLSGPFFTSVSAGGWHTCGVKTDGSVVCWGLNEDGQATPPAGSFTSVSAGGWHTCGVKTDDSVICWGYDEEGQAAPPAGSFRSVSAGQYHTCGVKTDGSVVCWGYDEEGQAAPPAGSFRSVSAGGWHTCGVKTDDSVSCWGYNSDGQAAPPAGSFTSVSAGREHTCGLLTGGSVACWGSNDSGETASPDPPTADGPRDDDHGNAIESATSVGVGDATQGVLDYKGDVDFFSFEVTEGVSYQVQVDVGTLSAFTTTLYGSDAEFLSVSVTSNARSGFAFPMSLEAKTSGSYYIAVDGGLDEATGSFTLTVSPHRLSTGVGTRENPVPFGSTFEVNTAANDHWDIAVLAITPDATQDVLAENPNNEAPEEGHQFFIASVRATYLGVGLENFDGLFRLRLRAIGGSGDDYSAFDDFCGVVPSSIDSFKDLSARESVEGNVCWRVPTDDVDHLVMFLVSDDYLNETRFWFSLR